MSGAPPLLVIAGATATGKTGLAVRVATELADLAKVESHPTMEGKSMTMILAPK